MESVLDAIIKKKNKKVLILYSSGLDSFAVAELYRNLNYEITLLYTNYGQKANDAESYFVQKYAKQYNCELIYLDKLGDYYHNLFNALGESVSNISTLFGKKKESGSAEAESNSAYVPYRNSLLLVTAMIIAEQLNIKTISFGGNLTESMTYSDNSEPFMLTASSLMMLGGMHYNKAECKVTSPLIGLTKTKIFELLNYMQSDIDLSFSCYYPKKENEEYKPCGVCGSCILRNNAKSRATIDPQLDWKKFTILHQLAF